MANYVSNYSGAELDAAIEQVKLADTTAGGTASSTNLITSGAVNAGITSVSDSIKDSTITLTQSDDTVIDSFTLNQASNKTIKLPELGKVDDVQIGGTSIVSNKVANIVPDTTEGGTYQSTDLITSGAVNAGIASVNANIKDSTITIKKNDGTTIDSFTLNQSSNKDITLPELGKIDDVQINGTTVVSNKVANITKAGLGISNVEDKSSATIRSEITSSNITTALGFTPMNAGLKGTANGVAELDSNGKVPSAQLPSFVDDVIEGYYHEGNFYSDSEHTQLITPESGKIYIDLHTNKTYRWSGSTYVEISASLALGETESTAYRGDRGKAAYDASVVNVDNTDGGTYQSTNLITSGAVNAGLASVSAEKVDKTITVNGHALSANVTVTATDVGLGNVGNFKAVSTVASQGLTTEEQENARANINVASLNSPALTGTPTAPTATAGTSTTQIATTEFVMSAIQTAIQNAMAASY